MRDVLLRVLIDTNVWISAFINPNGLPARVLEGFLQNRFIPVISSTLIDEISEVLTRPRIRRRRTISDEDVHQILQLLQDRAILVIPPGELHLCRDPEDDFLLETALLGSANCVVSRDDDLKRDLDLIEYLRGSGIEVLSVAQFLIRLST